jgi:hypothetical protein
MVQGGDTERLRGQSNKSSLGHYFKDESFELLHDG